MLERSFGAAYIGLYDDLEHGFVNKTNIFKLENYPYFEMYWCSGKNP